MLIGAFAACTPVATPVVPTLTLIPPTETATATPITPTLEPTLTPTPLTLETPTVTVSDLQALLETSQTPVADVLSEIRLAMMFNLNLPENRIQLAQVEEFIWFEDNRRCGATNPIPLDSDTDNDETDDIDETNAEMIRGTRYRMLVGSEIHEYHVDSEGEVQRCPRTVRPTDDLLLAVDAAAADMLFLVQRQVARELDLSTRRVELVSIAPYTWQDTSLGCPAPDTEYTQVDILGYRIVVEAGGTEYLFHTDTNGFYACDPDNEALPS